ncbi:probable cytochrome P450 6a13 [Achroia grisella]|uniref:probable cytochrome P450 6a13 n=1 Tax=Achroia grisella TaxID=688607 RepID=UPI0027D34BCC|nr:probable cytochrome P450 6a13 [Achroia grisella]
MIVLAILLVILALFYYYNKNSYKYWESKGIKHDKPVPIFGNNFRNFASKKSVTELAAETYWKYPNEKAAGFYRAGRPELVVRDPEIIKRILTTDFLNYYPRGLNIHKDNIEPIMRNLFFADGDLWRLLRQRMTPAFTSGKLKAMFPLIVERAEKLQACALSAAAAGNTIDARELMARYTTDFIGACGFGLDADSLNQDDSEFRKLGAKIFKPTIRDILVAILNLVVPSVGKHFKIFQRIESDILTLTKEILHQRNYEPAGRNDFVDLLLECKKKGLIVGESIERKKPDGSPETATLELDDALMAAQIFVFFAAGFETSSSATSFTLHMLAYNPEVQKKVQEDIDRVLSKYDNKLSYDAVKEMTYLDWTFKEGMRIFPSLGFLMRECVRTTPIPELNISVDAGVRVFIPIQALQNDPQYFEEPEKFRPERFSPEELNDANKYIYLPFGIGPRACIGERLGLMQSLAGLAAILSRFTVEPAPETKRYPAVNPRSGIVQSVKDGLPLHFKERKGI